MSSTSTMERNVYAALVKVKGDAAVTLTLTAANIEDAKRQAVADAVKLDLGEVVCVWEHEQFLLAVNAITAWDRPRAAKPRRL